MAGVYLQFLSKSNRDGEVLRLPGRSFILGRGNDCDVRVESEIASRAHAMLFIEDGSWVVRDRESRNGTWLNGKRVTTASLRPLDEIELGEGGPVLRVVTMDPAPPISEDGEDPTGTLRIHGKEAANDQSLPGRRARPQPAPSPAAATAEVIPTVAPLEESRPKPAVPAPALPPKTHRRPQRMPPIFALLGLGFAASVALGVWGPDFPYQAVTAPILWCMAAIRYLAPTAIPDPDTQLWVFRGLLACYGLTAGFLLQRPIRRIVLLLALASLHVLATLAL